VAGRRAALRLLLVLVATGVAGMHTLGHPTSDGHAGAADHSTALVIEPMAEAIGAAMTTAVHVDIYGTGMRLDPLTVCLAILAGSLLVLLVVLLVVYHRRGTTCGHVLPALWAAGRGPPTRSPLGLRLADLSVRRT